MSQPDEARRRQILDAADRLLRHYGPGKTTMAEIAREASIGVGTVYLEFPSKDAILEALSDVRNTIVLEAMRKAALGGAPSYTHRVRATFDAKVTVLLQLADEGAHAPDLVHCVQPAVQAAYGRFRAEESRLVSDLLRDAARAGEFDVRDANAMAATVLVAYASFAPPWLFRQPREEVLKLLRAMHDLVLRGLLHRVPEPRKNSRG
jgi:AcrR family transcriptional regulator